jgi:ribokinase
LNVDHLFAADALVTNGESFCRPVARQPGGSAANTIFALAKLSLPTRFTGAIGEDEDGRFQLESLASVGVDTSAVAAKSGYDTGFILGFVDKQGHRALYACPGANEKVSLEDLQRGLTPSVGWVHCSSFVGDEPFLAQRRFAGALPAGVRLSIAPGALYALRGIEALRPFFNRCDTVFLARPELETLTGETELLQGAKVLLRANVGTVAVTLGAEGSVVVTASTDHYQPAVGRMVVDTTGAGDAFAAGFIYGCFQGWAVEDAHRLAAVTASFVIEAWGARNGLPSLTEARTRYELAYNRPFPLPPSPPFA